MGGGDDVNEVCVGPASETAGRASSCAGCPSQAACSSGAARVDLSAPDIALRQAPIRHRVLVLSGKGGVGKSTVSCQLAFSLAAKDHRVGLMDIDICGPSVPRMMGLEGEEVRSSNSGWSPVFVQDNLAVMSVGFLLGNPDDAVIWRGPRKDGLIKQFIKDVDWGALDFLIVDAPPGTSDEHLAIVSNLKAVGISGAVIVTTPQEVALTDVRKEINFCKKAGVKILGIVENMAGFVCPKCDKASDVFPASTGGAQQLAKDYSIPFLGSLPLDPRVGLCAENGQSFQETFPEAPAARALAQVVQAIQAQLE